MSPSFFGHDFRRVARDLDADRATLRAIHAMAQSGDLGRAIAMAETALADGLEHPLLLNFSALRLENEGKLDAALALLRRAAAIAPADIGTLNALGLCLHRLERPEEALEAFNALLKLDPGLAFAHANRGAVYQALGRLDRAELGYRRGLELQPGLLTALAGLAAIASRKGAHAEARDLAQQVLKVQPNFPDATMSVAAAELAQGEAAAAEARIRDLIADPRPSRLERANATSFLGDVLDARGQAPAAFEAYKTANDELKALYASRFAQGQSTLDYTRNLIGYFDRAKPQAWGRRAAPPPDRPGPAGHVFLIGFPRSGTTLLELVLASHPAVATLEEQDVLIDGVRSFLRTPSNLDRLANAPESELAPARAAYWRRVEEAGVTGLGGRMLVDKMPLNTLKLPLIARLFPDAKILFARRDPRDVVLSCFRRRFQMNPAMYQFLSLESAADFYDATLTLAGRLDAVLGLATHVVRHESLVADFETEVRAVCAFLGLDWTEAMRDFAGRTRDRAIATPSTAQLTGGLNSDGVGHWRRYAAQLAPVQARLAPWVARFGYPAD